MKKGTPDPTQPRLYGVGDVVRLRDTPRGKWTVVDVLWREMRDGRPSHWVYVIEGGSLSNRRQRRTEPTWLLVAASGGR